MEFTVVELADVHLPYVRQQLALHAVGERLLGRPLLEVDLTRGRLWALVPVERAAEAAADLEFDAIRSDAEREALMAETARQLRPRLEGSPARLLVIEHWKAVEDLHEAPAHAFLVGDSEFDYVTSVDSDELIAELLGSVLWFPTVGLIGRKPARAALPGTRELTPTHVEEIVAGLDLLLIGAWDADGYVFWEPARNGVGPSR